MAAKADGPLFDEHYYRHDCGVPYERNEHWLSFFGDIADHIVRELAPASVLDVGCAMGFLVEALRARGVDAWGVDVSEYAIDHVHESVREHCAVASATGELPEVFPRQFDLVTCIEVVEHLPAESAGPAIARLSGWGRQVLFSSSPQDYSEPTHVNVLPSEEWAAMFVRNGLVRNFDVDASFLTPWAVLYERTTTAAPAVVTRYERRLERFRRENVDLRAGILRLQRAMAETEREWATALAKLGLEPTTDALERHLAATEALRADQSEARSALDEARAALDEARAALDEARAALDEANHEIARQQHQLGELYTHYQAAINGRDALNDDLSAATQLLQGAEAQLTLTSADNARLTDLTTELTDALRRAEHERDALAQVAVRAAQVESELQAVRASRTFRAGRAIASPLSFGRGLLRRRR